MTQEQNKLSTRLISLDVFRGIAIAGMILVNKAGVADKVYPFLAHADWNGCTLADLVFPFFLFIVGVAIAFSFSKYNEGATPPASVYWRILRRSLILFALGIFLNGFWSYNWEKIRIMGVLQRISVAYLLASLAVLKLPRKGQWALAILLLVGYWIAMTLIPVPGYGANVLTREGNIGAYIDRLIIPMAHLYRGDSYNSLGDPEGIFSTIPAVVTVLLGYFTGEWLRQRRIDSNTSMDLVLFGLGSLIIGILWDAVFPINKKLWTSSYVMFTAGWALLVLAACYELIEVRKIRRWGKPFVVLGVNAIAIFVASVLVIKILVLTKVGNSSTFEWINQNIFASWAGEINASLLFALVTLVFWWAIAYGMYRRGWFVKV